MSSFRYLFFLSFVVLLNGCAHEVPVNKTKATNLEFEKFNWLIGSWSAVSDKTHYQESWAKTNDSLLTGFAFMLSKTDTVFSEKLRIVFSKKIIFYEATVSGQNNGMPVRFNMMTNLRGLHIFENPSHTFPQKIIYFMKSSNQLFASVSGNENGKFRKEDFQLKRIIK